MVDFVGSVEQVIFKQPLDVWKKSQGFTGSSHKRESAGNNGGQRDISDKVSSFLF